MSLSPLHSSLTNDLHVSIASSFHLSFPRLHPTQAQFTIFRVLPNMLLLEPFIGESRSADAAVLPWHLVLSFLQRLGFSTLALAYWVDSLVRVSRRVGRSHFDKIARKLPQTPPQLGLRASSHKDLRLLLALLLQQNLILSLTTKKLNCRYHLACKPCVLCKPGTSRCETLQPIITLLPLPFQQFQVF